MDILSNSSRSTDQVTIEPNGEWSQNGKGKSGPPASSNGFNFSDDDDLIEIQDNRFESLKQNGIPGLSTNSSRTPPTAPRVSTPSTSSSFAPRPPGSNISGKRPAADVIDLTLSDDDEEPVRGPKRTYGSSGYALPQSTFDPTRT